MQQPVAQRSETVQQAVRDKAITRKMFSSSYCSPPDEAISFFTFCHFPLLAANTFIIIPFFFLLLFSFVTSFECPKEVTKKRAENSMPIRAEFSGHCVQL